MENIEKIKAERQELLALLKQLTDEQFKVNSKIQSTKDKIRENTEAYIQQYVDRFKPGSTWFIDNGYCHEYFKVISCRLDHYAYREENVEDCIIDIYGQYIQVPNPNKLDLIDKVNVQYKTKETIGFKISEIDKVKEIPFKTWANVIMILAETATES